MMGTEDSHIPYRNLGLALGTIVGVTAGAAAGHTETGLMIGAGFGLAVDVRHYMLGRKQATGASARILRTKRAGAEPRETSR